MARIKLFFLCFMSLLFSAESFAEGGPGLKEILTALEQGYASMQDLQANFSQRTYIGSLKREEKGGGELLLRKKGAGSAMFRFNYTKPRQQIISNGKTVWYYLPENRQVIVTEAAKLFSGGNAMAMTYLTGLGNLSADFSIQLLSSVPDAKGNYLLELVPKKQNNSVAKLQLSIPSELVSRAKSGSTGAFFPIAASVLHDQMGNRTTIEYSNVRVNSGVGSDRFTFKPPAGVEIIKQ